jgi:hypothetical protein
MNVTNSTYDIYSVSDMFRLYLNWEVLKSFYAKNLKDYTELDFK